MDKPTIESIIEKLKAVWRQLHTGQNYAALDLNLAICDLCKFLPCITEYGICPYCGGEIKNLPHTYNNCATHLRQRIDKLERTLNNALAESALGTSNRSQTNG